MVVADKSRPWVVKRSDGLQRHGNATGGHTDISSMSPRLIPGAVIVAKGSLYDHYGTITGPDTVVHPVKTGPLKVSGERPASPSSLKGDPSKCEVHPPIPKPRSPAPDPRSGGATTTC
jgi:hypothetical protein